MVPERVVTSTDVGLVPKAKDRALVDAVRGVLLASSGHIARYQPL